MTVKDFLQDEFRKVTVSSTTMVGVGVYVDSRGE